MYEHCPTCGLKNEIPSLRPGEAAYCTRCDDRLTKGRGAVVTKTLLFTVAALACYVPANTLPILSMRKFGLYVENTILSGCAALLDQGYWSVAAIVFVASILVPLMKLIGLLYLTLAPDTGDRRLYKTRVYRLVHRAGPWSMLDVFLVAIMVSLVKLGDLASVSAEPGLVAFTAVVVLTLFASASYDPRIVWSSEPERA